MDASLSRAHLYRLLALGFAYPCVEFLEQVRSGSYLHELKGNVQALSAPPELAESLSKMYEALSEVTDTIGVLEGEYTRLFARTVASPPNESSYGDMPTFGRAREMADVASFYAAFGFEVSPRIKELPDHVGMELEFMAVLWAKEAYAQEMGWQERAAICQEARGKFLQQHLGRWFPTFSEKVRTSARLTFYPALTALAQSLLATEQDAGVAAHSG